MVVFASGVIPDFEDDRTQAASAPPDRAILLRIVILLINQVRLVKDLLRLFKADTVLSFDLTAFRWAVVEARI